MAKKEKIVPKKTIKQEEVVEETKEEVQKPQPNPDIPLNKQREFR